ncbi:MAG: methyltransferase domain-containing protein [Bacteroidota bacterium]
MKEQLDAIKNYYQKRAKEYELVYKKPERQLDLTHLHTFLKEQFKNKYVLEVACGTGYWTKTIAESCTEICAIDNSEEVLKLAHSKSYPPNTVVFGQYDLWQFGEEHNEFDSVFGGFIWSHILKKDLPKFLKILLQQTHAKGELIFIDNKYVEGSSTPISRTDEDGNTYQIRQLQNGEEYEVLKNFPTKAEVMALVAELGVEMEWKELEYYWILKLKRRISAEATLL